MEMLPLETSKKRGIRLISVLLPEPVEPMKATVWPGWAVKFTSSSTYSSAFGYLK